MKLLLIAVVGLPAIACSLAASSAAVPTRQVHLDFHTSEHIPGIGERFNRQQWQDALRSGHVNSINICVKCGHGWSYYPTKVGKMHPNLTFDLLGEQIKACHEIGVRCPFYFNIGWAAQEAESHPDWCVRKRNGEIFGEWPANKKDTDPKPGNQWKHMCCNPDGSYHAMILRQIEEICREYPVDGFWFDIYEGSLRGCYCSLCKVRMTKEGIDQSDAKAVAMSSRRAVIEHTRQLHKLITRYHPQATLFFNHLAGMSDVPNTQLEIEHLPSVWGGYDKVPVSAKNHLQNGWQVVAMGAKFHRSWGEFGGFKYAEALKYEAAAVISFGVACNFGDQLHPSGEMDVATYRNIGRAFSYVEKIEEYGPGGKPYSRLGLWKTSDKDADDGASTILLENHQDFMIADESNLDGLKEIIIPSKACLTAAQAEAIGAWVTRGGKVLVINEGAMDQDKERFILDVGAEYQGPSTFSFDYTVVKPPIAAGLVTTPFLNYKPGMLAKLTTGNALAMIREPYFDRTYGRYSGLHNTPFKLDDSIFPAVIQNGNVIFLAHALDRMYVSMGMRLHRELVRNALDLLDPEPALKVLGLPSCGRVSLLHQKAKNRYVAHLLYSPVIHHGSVLVIEDFPAITNVRLELRLPEQVVKVRTIPGGEVLPVVREGNLLKVAVPAFSMHTGIVLEY